MVRPKTRELLYVPSVQQPILVCLRHCLRSAEIAHQIGPVGRVSIQAFSPLFPEVSGMQSGEYEIIDGRASSCTFRINLYAMSA